MDLGVAGSNPVGRPILKIKSVETYFVYILVSAKTGRSYVGQTDHLIRRYRMHCEGSTRTTREKLTEPQVAYWEMHASRADAMRREKYFKAGAGHRLRTEIVQRFLQDGRSVG